ncbi:hypothetical protein CJU90_3546 [Yarrowia sp. C11]|nr:hypothetical protein CKK34_5160 [Yarrowia sp. E02]KAG5367288.1 hypothetical protein CJU90_3546 [Yarrowia sp. C11]
MACCRDNCPYGLDIRQFGEGSSNYVEMYYDEDNMPSHNHLIDGSDVTEDVARAMEQAEAQRIIAYGPRPDNIPPDTECDSKVALWAMMNEWAHEYGFVFKGPISSGRHKGQGVRTFRFECCRTGGPDEKEACGYFVSANIKDGKWSVSSAIRKSKTHNHDLDATNLSETQTSLIESWKRKLEIKNPSECPPFLPKMRTFDKLSDLEDYLTDFGLSYKNENGSNFYFGWVKKGTDRRKNGEVVTRGITYACSRHAAGCKVQVRASMPKDGKWNLLHMTNAGEHNHPPADSAEEVLARRRRSDGEGTSERRADL